MEIGTAARDACDAADFIFGGLLDALLGGDLASEISPASILCCHLREIFLTTLGDVSGSFQVTQPVGTVEFIL